MMPNIPSNVKYDISIHKPANCVIAVIKEQLEFIFLIVKWNLLLTLSRILCFNIIYVHFRTAENLARQKRFDILLYRKSVVFVRLPSVKNHAYFK